MTVQNHIEKLLVATEDHFKLFITDGLKQFPYNHILFINRKCGTAFLLEIARVIPDLTRPIFFSVKVGR